MENKNKLIYQPTKIHPLFKKLLKQDVKKKTAVSINHGINLILLRGYKKRLTRNQIVNILSVSFGKGVETNKRK